jgi:arylformamidase
MHGHSVGIAGYRLCPEVGVSDIISDVRAAALLLYRKYGKRIVGCGHSAGGHLCSILVSTDWRSLGADIPHDLVRSGIGISGVYDLAPLIETEMNEQLRLDAASAAAVSPACRPVPADARFEAWVGAEESSEFLRQSRLIADSWKAAGAATRFEILPGANHFTAPNGLADPKSPVVAALAGLAAATEA